MFGLHSCLRNNLLRQQRVAGNAGDNKATALLQFFVLGISGTVVGLQEFMSTTPAPMCETLLSAGADPNGGWAGPGGGTLWTHLLFYYATRIKDSIGILDIATMKAFVRNGADLAACVDFQGTRFSPVGLVRSLLKDFPQFEDELTVLLGLLEESIAALAPIQITVSGPIEQACAPQLVSMTPPAWSMAIALEGGNLASVSSGSRKSLSSLTSAISTPPSEDGRHRLSRKSRFLRKIFNIDRKPNLPR